jgi:hypothetical protein
VRRADDVLGERAVDVDAHPPQPRVEVLAAGRGPAAVRVGVDVVERDLVADRDVRHAGAERVDDARRLVTRYARQLVRAEPAALQEQVAAADAARLDPHAHLVTAGRGQRPLDRLERPADAGEQQGPHAVSRPGSRR